MLSGRGWMVLVVMAACGRTDLSSSPPVAFVDPAEQTVPLSWPAVFHGSSSESDGAPVAFNWRVFSRPSSSVASILAAGPNVELRPDQPGDWTIELRVTSDGIASEPVLAVLHVEGTIIIFDGGVRDAGADAGMPDSGIDAGVRDAGVDGGVRDAGTDAGANPQPLDAGAVFIAGTLSEGACYRDALANVFTPNVASTGFDCHFENQFAIVRSTDGTLLYFHSGDYRLREYHCDNCSVTAPGTPYPAIPLANDPVVATPCPGTDRLEGFLVSADGEVLHRCFATFGLWRDSNGAVVHTNIGSENLLSLGASGWALSRSRLINWKTATVIPIVGLPSSVTLLTARWTPPDGFWIASTTGGVYELWRVDLTGAATRLGAYGPLPPNTSGGGHARLDGLGRLFERAEDTTVTARDIIVMKQVGQPTAVVYTEGSNPLVKLHISSLVTGP